MKSPAVAAPVLPGLRRRAEARVGSAKPGAGRSPALGSVTAADGLRLLHELQVHQVELEMQNAALDEARNRLEGLAEKYADLFDFAPVGYFSLDETGRILEVNLTGAGLLGVERSRLVGGNLSRFLAPASVSIFREFLVRVLAGAGTSVCEVALVKRGGASVWAGLHGAPVASENGSERGCRVAISDLSSLREAREARLRVEALSEANREMREEIVRRQAVERALARSQQDQAQLLKQSRTLQEQLRRLSHETLRAQEEERKRISRELHDVITQTLVGINVQLETLVLEASVDPADLRERIAQTQRMVEDSIGTVHEFARELRPTLLDDLGLIPTLHSYLKDWTKRTGVRVRFRAFEGVEHLNSSRRTALYRVAQSALANVAQHAHATQVEVIIRKVPGGVRLEIHDDGQSFQPDRLLHSPRGRRLGLLGMRERAEMVGGQFEVLSTPGRGTTVRVVVPIPEPARSGSSPPAGGRLRTASVPRKRRS